MKKVGGFFAAIIVAVGLVFGLQGCEKNLTSETVSQSPMLKFSTVDEYLKVSKEVKSMTISELQTWQNENGFKSLVVEAEAFYKSVNWEDFKTTEEIISFVKKNSKYLQIVEKKDGSLAVETVLYNSLDRYLVNEEQMFQVGSDVCKILSNATVSTKIEDIELLKEVNEQNVTSLKNNKLLSINFNDEVVTTNLKDATPYCMAGGFEDEDNETNDRDRTELLIGSSCSIAGSTVVRAYSIIRPYKRTLGIWYWCSRTITYDIKIAFDFEDTNYQWQRCFIIASGTISDSKVELENGLVSPYIYYPDYHIHAYDCYAKTPSTPAAELECNTLFFN